MGSFEDFQIGEMYKSVPPEYAAMCIDLLDGRDYDDCVFNGAVLAERIKALMETAA